jgi:hypothetical protein
MYPRNPLACREPSLELFDFRMTQTGRAQFRSAFRRRVLQQPGQRALLGQPNPSAEDRFLALTAESLKIG